PSPSSTTGGTAAAPRSSPSPPAALSGLPSAASPSAVLALLLVGPVAALALFSPPIRRRLELPPRFADRRFQGTALTGIVALLALGPMLGGEVVAFKAGIIVIFVVAAIGMHVLVNWTGQL